MDEEIPLSDQVNGEVDRRKLERIVADPYSGLSKNDLASAPILSVSACCQADMLGDEIGNDVILRCKNCGERCDGAEAL